MTKINLNALTADERQQLIADLQAAEKAAADRIQAERAGYKKLVGDTVDELFPKITEISADLAAKKKEIRSAFDTILEMKGELYGVKDGGQFSHQFISADGKRRIRIGANVLDNYDDTVNAGIEKVHTYINSLAKDSETQMLVDVILKLLSKDSKGTLKASKVLQLQQMAEKTGNADFIEGVKIIRDAYKPVESKSYVRAEYKNEAGAWISVPLGMTEAE